MQPMATDDPRRRRQRLALLAAGLAVLAAIGALYAPGLFARPPLVPQPDDAGASTLRVPAVGDDRAGDPRAAGAVAPDAAATRTGLTDADDVFVLVVRRRADRRPVAGAEVRFGRTDDEETARMAPRLDQVAYRDPDLELRASDKVTTDADGRAILPIHGDDGWLVTCTTGRLHGHAFFYASLRDDPGEQTLWLDDDAALHVEVREADGTPARDAPVALGWRGTVGGWRDVEQQVVVARTDAQGQARIAHAQRPSLFQDEPVTDVFVTLGDPGFLGPGTRVDLRVLPDRPIVLWRPATGRIVVEAASSLRVPGTQVQLVATDSTVEAWYCRLPLPADGRVVFEHVALGHHFRVQGFVGWVDAHTEVTGPTRPGEEVRVALTPRVSVLTLRGRALHDGAPVADRRLAFQMAGAGLTWVDEHGAERTEQSVHAPLTTDGEGRFVAPLPARWTGAEVTRALVRMTAAAGGLPLMTELAWTRVPSGPEIDLGDISLEEPPLLARGELVHDDGSAAEGWSLWCLPAGVESGPGTIHTWPVIVVGSRFAVHGRAVADEFALRPRSRRGGSLPPVLFRPGDEHLRVVVPRSGSIVASALAPQPIELQHVDMLLLQPGSDDRAPASAPRRGIDASEPRRLLVRWGDVPAGSYDLVVRCWNQPGSDVRIGGVQVAPGQETRDPRLQDLVLSGRRVRITAVDPEDGSVLTQYGTAIVHRPPEGPWLGLSLFRGSGDHFVQGTPEALVVMPGRVPTRVRLEDDVVQVALPSARRSVRVAWAERPDLAPDVECELRAVPILTDDEQRMLHAENWKWQLGDLVGRRPAVCALGAEPVAMPLLAGRWRLSATASRGDRTVPVEGIEPAELDLRTDQDLTLRASAAAWEKVRAGLGR